MIFAAQLFRYPSPLRDAVSGQFVPDAALDIPWGHLCTAPFSAYADLITFNSARQDKVLLAYLLLGYWAWRGFKPKPLLRSWAGYLLYLAAITAFLGWAILCPRPSARLRPAKQDDLILDFHSHTNRSWDARKSYSPEANVAWHRRMGFAAGFITDHNTMAGASEARARCAHDCEGFRVLLGEEVSLNDAHVAVLGPDHAIDNTLYNRNLAGLKTFLHAPQAAYGGLKVLSLPEYWLHHWERLELLAQWGASGVEIVNAVPKALDLPEDKKRAVIELCRRRNLFVVGVSDNHGWGNASFVWNIMEIPGQAAMGSRELEKAVLARLRKKGFAAVQVLTRIKHTPAPGAKIAFDPPIGLWTCLRAMNPLQAFACLAWIWGTALIPFPSRIRK